MKIVIGSDHGGFEMKQRVIEYYAAKGVQFVDMGTDSEELCDYKDISDPVCEKVLAGGGDFGILICGTGIGMSMAANRYKGIRAALVYNEFVAQSSKEHNNANVIIFGGRTMNFESVVRYIDVFNYAKFKGDRYIQRNEKLDR